MMNVSRMRHADLSTNDLMMFLGVGCFSTGVKDQVFYHHHQTEIGQYRRSEH